MSRPNSEYTSRGALIEALLKSQLRYTAALWRCFAYVVQSGDAELIAACGGLLGK